jgi:sensor c-di-GMP phosphodiesterase-like protein
VAAAHGLGNAHDMRHRIPAMGLVVLVGVLAVAAPIAIAIQEARSQALEAESQRALSYARDVVSRSNATATQIRAGIDRLRAARASDPCSDANIALMQRIALSSKYLQAIGRVEGGRLVCSSLGRHAPGLPLGPVDLVTPRGAVIRSDVELPMATGFRFLVVQSGDYAAIVDKDLPIDTTSEPPVSIALYSMDAKLLASRHRVDPRWIRRLGPRREATFRDGGYVVALARSDKFLTTSVAAIPDTFLAQRMRALAAVLLPIGALASLAMVLVTLVVMRRQRGLPALLKVALHRNEFFMAYQPIVDLETEAVVGVEALLRWRRRDGTVVPPDVFIPVAEATDLIQRLSERVLALVAHDVGALLRRHPGLHVAINLSAADLKDRSTVALLDRLLADTGVAPRQVVVEATERGLLHAEAAQDVIREIRTRGIRVAIDDFGTGYSSLSYLETFELDFLKIDKAFVSTVGTEAATSQVVPHIIGMAKDLRLEMVAEAVETDAQAAFLRARGVQYAQGWLFGRPMPPAALREWIEGANVEQAHDAPTMA